MALARPYALFNDTISMTNCSTWKSPVFNRYTAAQSDLKFGWAETEAIRPGAAGANEAGHGRGARIVIP